MNIRPDVPRPARGEDGLLLALAVIAGGFAGVAVAGFRLAIDWSSRLLLGAHLRPHSLSLLIVPCLTGLVIAGLTMHLFPASRRSGVNQTKAALYLHGGYLSLRSAVGKFVTAALAIGSGQSLGPEDPALHIGAAIGSWLGRHGGLGGERRGLMAPVGAAAGLAAAFGAPVSAVLFVIEEITGGWSALSLGAAMLAAAASIATTHALLGPGPLLHLDAPVVLGPEELAAYAGIGVAGGLLSVLFARLLAWLRRSLQALPRPTRYLQPALAGLLIGGIGYLGAPQVMGAGYGVIDQVAQGGFLWEMLGLLALLKLLATTLSLGSGTPGGMFAPTLVIGALLGASFGGAGRALLPSLDLASGTAALIGMSALFAGFLRAPITAIFMVVEVSGDYPVAVPAMIAATLAYLVSRRLQREPIFDLLARQDGLVLPSMESEREGARFRAGDGMLAPSGRSHDRMPAGPATQSAPAAGWGEDGG